MYSAHIKKIIMLTIGKRLFLLIKIEYNKFHLSILKQALSLFLNDGLDILRYFNLLRFYTGCPT